MIVETATEVNRYFGVLPRRGSLCERARRDADLGQVLMDTFAQIYMIPMPADLRTAGVRPAI